ncbi:ribosome maturation factor RimM [Roseivirga sp. BDSF3-8]|uniref:ribosome maturation factor RimM n=1 Tax=Roseivirga sp. BDSF3-8 TaxID=3241598 RepID=UPI00353220EE
MQKDDCYQLGYVIRKHGTKGEVQAFLDVDDPEAYEELESVFVLKEGDTLIPFFIDTIEIRGQKAVIKFEDIETVPEAEKMVGSQLYLPLEVLPELSDNQFYYHEVIGYTVVDKTLGPMGTVKSFITLGPQHLMEMDYKEKQVLIPVTDHIVIRPDRESSIIHVDLPEGLLDIYL